MTFVAADPVLRAVQGGLLLSGAAVVFLLFHATRDIMLRTKSFAYQFASILLVAGLPVVGYLVYLLIRPARTIKERELEAMLTTILQNQKEAQKTSQKHQHKHHHQQKPQQKSPRPLPPVLIAKQPAFTPDGASARLSPVTQAPASEPAPALSSSTF